MVSCKSEKYLSKWELLVLLPLSSKKEKYWREDGCKQTALIFMKITCIAHYSSVAKMCTKSKDYWPVATHHWLSIIYALLDCRGIDILVIMRREKIPADIVQLPPPHTPQYEKCECSSLGLSNFLVSNSIKLFVSQ